MNYSFRKWAGILLINMHIQTILLGVVQGLICKAEPVILPSGNVAVSLATIPGGGTGRLPALSPLVFFFFF